MCMHIGIYIYIYIYSPHKCRLSLLLLHCASRVAGHQMWSWIAHGLLRRCCRVHTRPLLPPSCLPYRPLSTVLFQPMQCQQNTNDAQYMTTLMSTSSGLVLHSKHSETHDATYLRRVVLIDISNPVPPRCPFRQRSTHHRQPHTDRVTAVCPRDFTVDGYEALTKWRLSNNRRVEYFRGTVSQCVAVKSILVVVVVVVVVLGVQSLLTIIVFNQFDKWLILVHWIA